MARRPSLDQLGLKPDRSVTAALAGMLVIYLVFRFGGEAVQTFFINHLLLTPNRAIGLEPWQLLTSAFVHPRLGALFMTTITMLFFGNQIERQMGEGMFWKLYLAGALVGGLAAGLMGRLLAPAMPIPMFAAAPTALLLAFGSAWRHQRVMAYGMAQMQASTMAFVFFGITVISVLLQLEDMPWQLVVIELAALTGAGAAGWFMAARGGGVGLSLDRFRAWRLKRRYRVLTGGRDSRDDKRWLN